MTGPHLLPPRPSRTRRRAATALLLAAAVTSALTGCTSEQASTPGSTITVGTVTRTSGPTQTVTRTASDEPSSSRSVPPSSRSAPPSSSSRGSSVASSPVKSAASSEVGSVPAPTPLPAARESSCPYLTDDQLILLTGQRNGPTRVIDTAPQPICLFRRSDEGWMAAVRIFRAADAAGAAAIVDAHIPVADSSPADQPATWTGGYTALPDGSTDYPESRAVYGVSKGEYAVIVWTNQPQTVKARRVVIATIENLGL